MNAPPLSRLHVERVIGATRVGLASASLFAVWMDPAEPQRYAELTYSLHAAYLCYSIVLAAWTWRRDGTGRWPMGTQVMDIAVASVLQYLTFGPSSPFFVYFVFALFSAALRWGWRGTVRMAAVVMLAFVAMSLWLSHTLGPSDFELNRFIIRVAYLLVVTVVLTYLGQHEERMRNEMRRLARWPVFAAASAEQVVPRILEHSTNVVDARECLLAWSRDDEPWLYTAAWPRTNGLVHRHRPDAFDPMVSADLADRAFIPTGPEVHPELMSQLGAGSVASAPFRTDVVSGRVFFGGCRAAADDLLPVVEIVARDIGWTLDQALAADRAREMAISAERIRVARDLHDGVLQSLTGIRLELQASAADDSTPPVLSERLVDMERALALEQRELRRFIHGLRPAALAGAGDSALADVLDEVRRRIVLEWRAPITIAIHPNDLVLPAPVDRDVCHMVHEGIVNALKHGSPSRVSVDIRMTHETLRIAITDDGRGFPFHGKQDHTELASANTGPASLRERVEALGGRIAVESAANGSCVELFVPVGAAVG